MQQEQEHQPIQPESKKMEGFVSKTKLLAFAFLLTVPAVLSGCGQQDECDPDYDAGCEYDSGSGHYYYGGGGYYGGSSRSSSNTSDGSSHSGFGSGSSHSSFGG